MSGGLGQALRALREAAGLTLAEMANRTHYSKPLICNVEAGRREPSMDLIESYDDVLGTQPLCALLWEMDDKTGDHVKRRAFLTAAGAVSLLGVGSAAGLAEVVRSGLQDVVGDTEDWDSVLNDYNRRLVTDPNDNYGHSLMAQMLVAKQQLVEKGKSPDLLRAMAGFSQLYGLWLGNKGHVASARGWYRTASVLADRSGDPSMRVYVRGRTLSRGPYEGYTVDEIVNGVEEALSLTNRPCAGTLEAHSALVHVHALQGNLAAGRMAVERMRRVADALSSQGTESVPGPLHRTIQFNSYLECRIGPTAAADRAFGEAEPLLRSIPVWHADARVYYARAMVRAGDVEGGITYALDAVTGLDSDVHVVKIGVADLISAVPPGTKSDALHELCVHAVRGKTPWESLV